MGYGFGIWLMYSHSLLKTPNHIGHVTLSCFMQKNEASKLYDELISKCGKTAPVLFFGKNPKLYEANYYTHDNNDICSWGYDCYSKKWESFKPICNKYICDQPEQLHTSIEYHTNFETFKPKFMDNFEIECDIKLVDITSDKPEEWKIIK